jgi:ribonuclease HII
MLPLFLEELNLMQDMDIVGIDEVGRGSLAGAVCAAAVVWPRDYTPQTEEDARMLELVKDSKKLSSKRRDVVASFIKMNAAAFAISMVDNREIDSINILNATYKAMHLSLDQIDRTTYDRIAVDGDRFKTYMDTQGNFVPHVCIVNGDNKLFQIAAASILAKCARDNAMIELHQNHPIYQWEKNKGYGTKVHIEAIQTHGKCPLHRNSFLKNITTIFP